MLKGRAVGSHGMQGLVIGVVGLKGFSCLWMAARLGEDGCSVKRMVAARFKERVERGGVT